MDRITLWAGEVYRLAQWFSAFYQLGNSLGLKDAVDAVARLLVNELTR